jgi:hypothetical protein
VLQATHAEEREGKVAGNWQDRIDAVRVGIASVDQSRAVILSLSKIQHKFIQHLPLSIHLRSSHHMDFLNSLSFFWKRLSLTPWFFYTVGSDKVIDIRHVKISGLRHHNEK